MTKLNLSLPTVPQYLQELQGESLVSFAGSIGNTGGRKARTYSLVADARAAIGPDITQHHVTTVAIDLSRKIIYSLRRRAVFSQTDEYYQILGKCIADAIDGVKLNQAHILGVVIGVPGLVSQDHQEVIYGKTLHFTGALCKNFARYIPFPTMLYHDVDVACFAETRQNYDIKNAFYIMLSNSVGGAIYINNQLYYETGTRAGEIGHMLIEPNGKLCYYGCRGCLDTCCASSVLASLTDGNLAAFFDLLEKR